MPNSNFHTREQGTNRLGFIRLFTMIEIGLGCTAAPRFQTPQELAVDRSVRTDAAWATAVLKKAGECNPDSQWVFRPTRSTIKQDARALVLFGTEAAAAKDADDKKEAQAKIKRRRLRTLIGSAREKAAALKAVASATADAKTLRGTALSVESFAHRISFFVGSRH